METAVDLQIRDLLTRQREGVESYLRDVLTASGIDPDDRSDGWEDRARHVLGRLEAVDSTDMSDPYRMTVTTEIRPRRPV